MPYEVQQVVKIISACPKCGQPVQDGDKFCEYCGAGISPAGVFSVPPPPPPPPFTSQQVDRAEVLKEKSPFLAVFASFLFAGLGQVYNGQLGKGILFFFGVLFGSLSGVLFDPSLITIGILVWIYGLFDAYQTAKKMNSGEMPFRDYSLAGIVGYIILGIVAFVIFSGFLAFLSDFLNYLSDPEMCFGFDCEY